MAGKIINPETGRIVGKLIEGDDVRYEGTFGSVRIIGLPKGHGFDAGGTMSDGM